jgi:hypothetical protein
MQSLDPTRTQLCLFSEAKHQELKVRKATSLCLVFVYPRARYLKFHRQTPLSLDRVHAVKSQISQIKKSLREIREFILLYPVVRPCKGFRPAGVIYRRKKIKL